MGVSFIGALKLNHENRLPKVLAITARVRISTCDLVGGGEDTNIQTIASYFLAHLSPLAGIIPSLTLISSLVLACCNLQPGLG